MNAGKMHAAVPSARAGASVSRGDAQKSDRGTWCIPQQPAGTIRPYGASGRAVREKKSGESQPWSLREKQAGAGPECCALGGHRGRKKAREGARNGEGLARAHTRRPQCASVCDSCLQHTDKRVLEGGYLCVAVRGARKRGRPRAIVASVGEERLCVGAHRCTRPTR